MTASVAPFACQMALVVSAGRDGEEVNETMQGWMIGTLDSATAARLVVARHYLHRRPPISHAFGLYVQGALMGVVTYGTPASRHLQIEPNAWCLEHGRFERVAFTSGTLDPSPWYPGEPGTREFGWRRPSEGPS